jgi:hypothetical protein
MAVETDIGVRIGADIGPLQRDLNKAGGALKAFGKDARASLDSAARGIAAGMAAAAGAITAMTVTAASGAKELQRFAQIADTSASSFQRLAYGAKTVGIEQDKLADIFKDVKDRVGDFLTTGGGPMVDFFEQIAPKVGVTAEQFRYLSGPQALQLFVDSLEAANLSQAELTFYMETMASDATALLPLLRDNGKAMAQMSKEADALGLVLSDIDVANLTQASRDIDDLKGMFGALSDEIGAEFAPILRQITAEIKASTQQMGGMNKIASDAFKAIIRGAGFALDAIEGVKRVIIMTADAAIIAGRTIASAFITALKPVRLMIQGIVSAIEAITPSLDEAIAREEKRALSRRQMVRESAQRELKELREKAKSEETTRLQSIQRMLDDMDNFNDQTVGIVGEAWANIKATLMEPLPSTALDEFVIKAQEAANQTAQALASATQRQDAPTPGAPTEAPAFTQEQALALPIVETEDRLAALRDSFKSEFDLIAEQNAMRLAQIEEFKDAELLLDGEYESLREQQAEKHSRAMAALKKAENSATVTSTEDMFNQLMTLGATRSKKIFEAQKAVSIASATIKGIKAAINSYEFGSDIGGPPVGAAFAAVSAATTGAMIQQIRSQQFNGGGSGAVATGGGGGAAAAAQTVAGPATQSQAPLEVRMSGLDADAMFSGQMISSMFDKLRQEAGDRGVRFIA